MGPLSLAGRRRSDTRGDGLGGPLGPFHAGSGAHHASLPLQGLWGSQIPAGGKPWTW